MIFWSRLALIITSVTVFVIANLPAGMVSIGSSNDKLNHAMAFAVLTPLVILAFPAIRLWWVFVGLIAFNGCIELSQAAFGFGRQADILDWLAGVVATAVVMVGFVAARAMSRLGS